MFHLIFNPVAGRGRVPDALPRVRRFFAEAGVPVEVFVTRAPREATAVAAALPPEARVLAMGGDGTLQEVAAACAGSGRTLGVLPVGSGDDFAFALGLDRFDLEAALRRILAGRVRRVDTGLANGRRFINTVGMGFDADVAGRVLAAPRLLRGRNAYLYGVFATLARLRSPRARVVLDGRLVHDGPALLISAQNGPRTGGSFLFAPEAAIDDGALDVLIAGAFGRLGAVAILPRVMAGRHLGHTQVKLLRGARLSVTWQEPRPAHLEGEVLPPCCDYDIRVEPGSLAVYC